MSVEQALESNGPRVITCSGRRRVLLAGGCVLAAAALAFGTAQASQAAAVKPAATPGAGWHSYNPNLDDSSLLDVYAPTLTSAWGVGETESGGSFYIHFNGSSWASVSGPDIGVADGISGTGNSDLWVIAASETAHYNGSTWTTDALAIPAGQTALGNTYVASDEIYAAGPADAYAEVDTVDNGAIEQILEHFNGTKWSVVTDAPNISVTGSTVYEVTGSGPDDVYVTANYNNDQNSEVVHFNGTAWSVESMPGTPFGVSIAVTGSGTAMALGYDESSQTYAAQLSGGTWSKVSFPAGLEPLQSDLSSAGKVWAQLQTSAGSDGPTTLWEYAGSKWTTITPDDVTQDVYGVVNGAGFWTFTTGGVLGGDQPDTTALYVG
jgi:hypothetical protein